MGYRMAHIGLGNGLYVELRNTLKGSLRVLMIVVAVGGHNSSDYWFQIRGMHIHQRLRVSLRTTPATNSNIWYNRCECILKEELLFI